MSTIRLCSVVFGVTSSLAVKHDSRSTVTVYSARSRLVGLALYSHGRRWLLKVPGAWLSNTRSKQKACRKVQYTNHSAAVIDSLTIKILAYQTAFDAPVTKLPFWMLPAAWYAKKNGLATRRWKKYSSIFKVPIFSYLTLNNIVTVKSELEVTQNHSNWYHLKAWMRFSIRLR